MEAIFGPEANSADEILSAYRESGAKLACLCASDRTYAESAAPVAAALKGAGATLYSAGRPGEMEAALRGAGVADFIFVGCDMYDVLERALKEAR